MDYNFTRKRHHVFSSSSGTLTYKGTNLMRQTKNILNDIHLSQITISYTDKSHWSSTFFFGGRWNPYCLNHPWTFVWRIVALKEDFYVRQNLHSSIHNWWNKSLISCVLAKLKKILLSVMHFELCVLNFSRWLN